MTDPDPYSPASDLAPAASLELIAYAIGPQSPMPIVPASQLRTWMEGLPERFAYRCLPMLLANQAGWFLINTHSFRVVWDGGSEQANLNLLYLAGAPPYPASSMFGHGILTFTIPYLFRTPPGYNLLVRGPANWPKDGTTPLEGLVETDWAVATFTMNWQLTRPQQVITFEEGEPIAMLVPQRRGELEGFTPRQADLASLPSLAVAHRHWATSRHRFQIYLRMIRPRRGQPRWQKHYFHGTSPSGVQAEVHQLKLKLRPFQSLPVNE